MTERIKGKVVSSSLMSLPYHRGHTASDMNQRGGQGSQWGTREQRVEEGNRTIMEQENDRKWVRSFLLFSLHSFCPLFALSFPTLSLLFSFPSFPSLIFPAIVSCCLPYRCFYLYRLFNSSVMMMVRSPII